MLYLVRHGQTDWNKEPARCQGWVDGPLNDTGREQARAEARRLAGHGIERVVTSHLLRARQTALIVRDELIASAAAADGGVSGHAGATAADGGASADVGAPSIELAIDERLAETRRGAWEGRTFAAIMAEEPEEWRHYREHPESFRFPGGESLFEQQSRVLAAVRDAADDGRRAVLVTHGGSIRLVRTFLDGAGIESFHTTSVGNGDLFELPCAGLGERIAAFLEARAAAARFGAGDDEAGR